MNILIDAFGGDNAPLEVIRGGAQAVQELGVTVTLVGDEQKIRDCAEENGLPLDGMEILHAPAVFDIHEEPTSLLKQHADTSMAVGMQALHDGKGDAFVCAGSTGALLVGATVGRSLAFAWDVPAIPVHHMEGHLLAPMLEDNPPEFPFVALLVSGGHTQLISVTGIGQYELLGESIDDAAGEAFDKTAKLLGLDYPGGPLLSKMAAQGTAGRFVFPRPMTDRPGLDFSFSGLKTFAANTIRDNGTDDQTRADIAHAFEDAVVDTLMIKCKRALDQTGFKRLVMAGGVSANRTLRAKLAEMMKKRRGEVFYARPEFCTDNGAMIAYAGMVRFKAGATADLGVSVRPRWPLAELPAA